VSVKLFGFKVSAASAQGLEHACGGCLISHDCRSCCKSKPRLYARIVSILMHRRCIRMRDEALAAARFVHAGGADGDAFFGFKDAL
jgi:hypothetical protein